MVKYKSKSGNESGVTGYEIGRYSIIVEFNHSVRYQYTYNSTGSLAVEAMKQHALFSEGLSTYISLNNPRYEYKYRPLFCTFKSTYKKIVERVKPVKNLNVNKHSV